MNKKPQHPRKYIKAKQQAWLNWSNEAKFVRRRLARQDPEYARKLNEHQKRWA